MTVNFKRKLVISAILIFSIGGMLALSSMKPEPPKKPIIDKTMLVEFLDLKPNDVTFQINSQGTVNPRTETVLSAEVSGRIVSISDKFIAGGLFKKNEILMRIDPTDYEVAVSQAEALLKQRQIEYKGAKSLRSKGYRAESDFAAAQAALASAKASVVRAKKNLDRTKIRLPYDGLVRTKNSDIGQFVNPGTNLGTAFSTKSAEIRLALTDQDLAFLDLPEIGSNQNSAYNGPLVKLSAIRKGKYQTWNAKIVRTEGVVDVKSRVTYVIAEVNDPYRLSVSAASNNNVSLPIGTFVKAIIDGKSFPSIVKVPRSALRGKNQLMFIDSESRLQIKEVEIIRADSRFAYIQQLDSPLNRISITALESPVNGMKLRTADQDPINTRVADETNSDSNKEALNSQAQ